MTFNLTGKQHVSETFWHSYEAKDQDGKQVAINVSSEALITFFVGHILEAAERKYLREDYTVDRDGIPVITVLHDDCK